MAIVIKINDSGFRQYVRQATAVGLQRAGMFLYRQCVQAVRKPNTHRSVATFSEKQQAKTRGQKTGVRYANMHNAYAGLPPFLRTGHGQSNIVYEFNGKQADPRVRVGIKKNAIYMIYLELGTRRIAARPWLAAMALKHRVTLGRLICTGGKQ